MADFKLVFNFFSAGTKGGTWSETWYRNATDLKGASTLPQALLKVRLALLNAANTLNKIRVSQVLNPRVTTIINVRQNGFNFQPTPPAPIDSAVIVTVSSSAQPATRRWWLRGWDVGDAFRDTVTGNDKFGDGFVSNVADFLSQAAKAGFEVLPIQKTTVPGFGYYAATLVDGSAGNGQSIITLTQPPIIQVGATVILGNFSKKDLPGLNGRFTVLAVAGNTLTVPYQTPENFKVIVQGARLRQLGYISGATIDPTISGITFLGGRKTKSPFTGSRGARSANRKLRLSP